MRGEGKPIWERTAPSGVDRDRLGEDVRCDVCVIGGGFSGLSTALHLREGGASVAVLEAGRVGDGASGRNTGQVIPVLKRDDPDVLRATIPFADALLDIVGSSAGYLFKLVERHGIDCDARQIGWVQPAHNAATLRVAERRFRAWDAEGADVAWLDRDEVHAKLGSPYYNGAVRWSDGGTVNPLALCRGLAHTASEMGARLFEQSPAIALTRRTTGWTVRTPHGSVDCEAVVLATAAYSGPLVPALANSFVPLSFFQIATEPLEDEQIEASLPRDAAFSDLHRDMHWFRHDSERRLVTGTALVSRLNWRKKVTAVAYARTHKIFPGLRDVHYVAPWSGQVAMTRDYLPKLFRTADGLAGWYGCNGRGVALSISMGRVLADLLNGVSPDLPVESLRPTFGASRIGPVVGGAMLNAYRALDHLQL
jgi:glycine/D-amino acid oxidase-like deaminating enzyme